MRDFSTKDSARAQAAGSVCDLISALDPKKPLSTVSVCVHLSVHESVSMPFACVLSSFFFLYFID